MSALRALVPRRLEAQVAAVIALALLALLLVLVVLEVLAHETALETAEGRQVSNRLERLYPLLSELAPKDMARVLQFVSSCHEGYTVTDRPFEADGDRPGMQRLRDNLARSLSLPSGAVRAGYARLSRDDFSYDRCSEAEIDLPLDGVVLSLQLASGMWLNREVHPHEWHVREKTGWMLRASAAFAFVGCIAIVFIHRLSRPLNRLTQAAHRFGAGLEVSALPETGPSDVRRAIGAFNTMQRRVAEEIERRTGMLVAISHDLRTPITALRVRAELVEDQNLRHGLIAGIDRLERLTRSALEFLRGPSRSEPLRTVDISALVESECVEFEETGRNASFDGEHGITGVCRPEALARAVRNLIDNALKYGGGARVSVQAADGFVTVKVCDSGPGIPAGRRDEALEPFRRLSPAREDQEGGFGLGLSIARSIAEGHDGELVLQTNPPRGLVAMLRFPMNTRYPADRHRGNV